MRRFLTIASLAGLAFSVPAVAEVAESDDDGFVTRDTALVDASAKQVWLALISPARWWNAGHTWSGDAANLSLRPQAGGCFCERIPEDPNADRVTLEGSVEHMRVIQANPERALRMAGALGPLQSEAVTGVLTIAIAESGQGTRIAWEYAVSGRMRYEIPVIAKAVDGVLSQQLDGLANLLGRIDSAPAHAPEPEAAEPEPETGPASAVAEDASVEDAIDAMAQRPQ